MEAARRFTLSHLVIATLAGVVAALAVAKLLSIVFAPQLSTDPPIKVNGGAMTFWTRKGVKFDTPPSGNNAFCVPLGTSASSSVQLKLFQPDNYSGVPDQQITLTNPAQVDLFGFKGTGFAPSNNGIRILIKAACGNSTDLSAWFQPEDSGNSSFYQNMANAAAPSGRHFVRFQDLACPSPPSPSADEDACEHLDRIYVNGTPTGAPWGQCNDGECRLMIGP